MNPGPKKMKKFSSKRLTGLRLCGNIMTGRDFKTKERKEKDNGKVQRNGSEVYGSNERS